MGRPADGGLGYTAEDLIYLLTVSIPFGGLHDVDVRAGEKVIISPASGAFGSAAVVAALAMGARVIAMDRNVEAMERLKTLSPEGRLRIVQNKGDVDADVKQLTKDGLADVFFDISPIKAIESKHFRSCMQLLRCGGWVSLMSVYDELPLPISTIMLYDITVKGEWMYTKEDMHVMINLVETGYMKLGAAGGIKTVGSLPLEKFAAAFDAAAKMSGPCLQAVIVP